jgi:hypothetical protein
VHWTVAVTTANIFLSIFSCGSLCKFADSLGDDCPTECLHAPFRCSTWRFGLVRHLSQCAVQRMAPTSTAPKLRRGPTLNATVHLR